MPDRVTELIEERDALKRELRAAKERITSLSDSRMELLEALAARIVEVERWKAFGESQRQSREAVQRAMVAVLTAAGDRTLHEGES